jgi:hypothetical protein
MIDSLRYLETLPYPGVVQAFRPAHCTADLKVRTTSN